jgi:hypothetical protein
MQLLYIIYKNCDIFTKQVTNVYDIFFQCLIYVQNKDATEKVDLSLHAEFFSCCNEIDVKNIYYKHH